MEVKLASQKWRQLQNKLSQSLVESTQAIDLDTALLGAPPDSGKKKPPKLPDVDPDENQTATQTKIKLPSLSGILRNTDIHGRASAAAVIDGHRLKENDIIQGFRIRRILEDGVELSSSGQTWFLRAPDVVYSRVHATSGEGKASQ
jgi:hypothetical protein